MSDDDDQDSPGDGLEASEMRIRNVGSKERRAIHPEGEESSQREGTLLSLAQSSWCVDVRQSFDGTGLRALWKGKLDEIGEAGRAGSKDVSRTVRHRPRTVLQKAAGCCKVTHTAILP